MEDTAAIKIKNSEFRKFIAANPGFRGFLSEFFERYKTFIYKGDWCRANERDMNEIYRDTPTLADAWDMLANDKCEHAGDILCMFAEYALADGDRKSLLKVFTEILYNADGIMHAPFDSFRERLASIGDNRDEALKLRDEIEAYVDTLDKQEIYNTAYSWDEIHNMPKAKRVKIKDDLQNARLSTAFLLAIDAFLCGVYSHGKLLMFWRILNECLSTASEGTIIGEYGSTAVHRGEPRLVPLAKIANPLRNK